MIVRAITWLIKRLPPEKRASLVNAVIHSWDFPVRAIITTDERRRILVEGRPLSIEQTQQLRESAYALHTNQARRLIRDQVRTLALENGYLKNPESDRYQDIFYKAALWFSKEEDELVQSLSNHQDSETL